MAADGDSFLPRIQSVFYAVFDVTQGPKIVYQVPEGLISCSPGTTSFSSSPVPASVSSPSTEHSSSGSRASSISLASPPLATNDSRSKIFSPQKRSLSSARTLFNFDDISKKYRVIGFPTQLRGKYERNHFRFNVCFVFDRTADLSCYEPVVRKVSRVLTSCEEESSFLSSPDSSFKIHAVLEQLYEDLNSYSETSISLDRFNSIELKIFPFYPNPPPVKDWMVPLALIDLKRVIEPNWDLTMAKVCQYIDGINHVSRIANFAECDVELTRQAISHLLFYQVIMTIDIFQYSNMYTLRKSAQWLADEAHVREECGAYVAKPGRTVQDWPKLLRLYSRFRPGTTVFDWMQENDVRDLGIDVRRFTSFGVIKGFLRRVHRWPIFVAETDPRTESANQPPSPATRHRSISLSDPPILHTSPPPTSPLSPISPSTPPRFRRRLSGVSSPAPIVSLSQEAASSTTTSPFRQNTIVGTNMQPLNSAPIKYSATESLAQLQSRSGGPGSSPQKSSTTSASFFPSPLAPHPRVPRSLRAKAEGNMSTAAADGRRHSLISPESLYEVAQALASVPKPLAKRGSISSVIDSSERKGRGSAYSTLGTGPSMRPRLSRSPSSPALVAQQGSTTTLPVNYPPELVGLLDGEHHTDELCTRFEVGWPTMEKWLAMIGDGRGEGDLGKVLIIYR